MVAHGGLSITSLGRGSRFSQCVCFLASLACVKEGGRFHHGLHGKRAGRKRARDHWRRLVDDPDSSADLEIVSYQVDQGTLGRAHAVSRNA